MSNPSSTRFDEFVVHRQIDDDVGIAPEEVAYRRHQMEIAEAHWRADAQLSAGSRPHLFDGAISVFEIGQDPRRALEIGMSRFGQAQRSRRPVQETGAELALEVADLPADRRFRDPQAPGGLSERLRLPDGDKRLERGKLVHLFSRRTGTRRIR